MILRREQKTTDGSAARWATGIGLGAAFMYVLDPVSGRRRRGLIRDKAAHARHVGSVAARKTATDFRHRSEGLAATVFGHGRHYDDEKVLASRVRSAIGTVCSHPGAIDVRVNKDHITLLGPILEREADKLVRRVKHVPGVGSVTDNLARHKSAEHISSLQGGRRREARFEFRQENWAPAPRLVAGAAGLGLSVAGLRLHGLRGGLAAGTGIALLLRAVTNMPMKRMLGVGGGWRGIDVKKDIHIQAPISEVFDFFRNLENLPKFMTHLRQIEVHEDRTWWEAVGPAGIPIHWEAEITRFEPNRRIAWKSLPGSFVRNAGFVRFDEDHKGTLVEIQMSYNPVGGIFAHAIATLFGSDPKHAMDEDLLRLKSLLEYGKTRARGHEVRREEVARRDGEGERPEGPSPEAT